MQTAQRLEMDLAASDDGYYALCCATLTECYWGARITGHTKLRVLASQSTVKLSLACVTSEDMIVRHVLYAGA